MSLRSSAPEFQPNTPYASPALTAMHKENTHVLSIPELGYEFPYTMKTMPISINHTPAKRMWSEMTNTIFWHFKRHY